ncbi:hypothetical protein GCWU000341_00863 [Oribacterium sp. oral taxon 078 str. F0262]|nr:hypothetical protein GCWU000341_00863 [Oribacterium sp. oral taxon 078 str. F0262]
MIPRIKLSPLSCCCRTLTRRQSAQLLRFRSAGECGKWGAALIFYVNTQ